MDKKQIDEFTYRLEKERELLESELKGLGVRNPSNPSDWMPAKPEDEEFGADRNSNADIIEEMQDDNASLNELEGRLNMVTAALERIDAETFGKCEVCDDEIQAERLQANPAATTCLVHMPPRQ